MDPRLVTFSRREVRLRAGGGFGLLALNAWLARRNSIELANRLPMAASEALDLNREPAHLRQLYGLDQPQGAQIAAPCLTARRRTGDFHMRRLMALARATINAAHGTA